MRNIAKLLLVIFLRGHRSWKTAIAAYLALLVNALIYLVDTGIEPTPLLVTMLIVVSIIFFLGGCYFGSKKEKKNNIDTNN